MNADAVTGTPAFDLTPDQRETLDAADRYARNELYPLAERMDREEWWPAGAFAALGATLFLGGWAVPAAWADLNHNMFNLLGPVILLVKMCILGGLIFFIRFTFPRLREDQLQRFAWVVLIPVSLVNILATTVLKVAF